MSAVYIIVPVSQLATLTGYASEVDAALGLPMCNCASCAFSRGQNCTRAGGCPSCRVTSCGTPCPTYSAPGSDPMHGVAVTTTYCAPLTSADGTQCAYLYDDTTGPIIDPGGSMSPVALPDGWLGNQGD